MSSRLLPPPEPFDLRCNTETWAAEKLIVRVHDSSYSATELNPGKGGRLPPFPPGEGWNEVAAAAEAAGITIATP